MKNEELEKQQEIITALTLLVTVQQDQIARMIKRMDGIRERLSDNNIREKSCEWRDRQKGLVFEKQEGFAAGAHWARQQLNK